MLRRAPFERVGVEDRRFPGFQALAISHVMKSTPG
jgi:hypothetical protein